MSSLNKEIKKPYSRVFRRLLVKRKSQTTGLFESTWQDLSDDVQSWGKARKQIDAVRYGQLTFSDLLMKLDNTSGRYNPEDDEFSLWFGYGSQQRSLVKIEAGFLSQEKGANGIWTNTEFPSLTAVMVGIVSGDIALSDQNAITFPVRPLLQIFKDFPARNLSGFTATGLTASQFMTMLRDQTDGAGSFMFRPFFGDTTANWNISATTNVYPNLNTSTADDVYDSTVWQIIAKLTEAENMVVYVKRDGTFNFTNRNAGSTSAFHFSGVGFNDTEYGHTIKRVTKYGKKQTDYYSRVEVKFNAADTLTSVRVLETGQTVTGSNAAWDRGNRTYQFENVWIGNTATADLVLSTIFNTVSVLKNQIELISSFVPHLEVLDRVSVSFDSGDRDPNSRWDNNDWASAIDAPSDLVWAVIGGDAIRLVNQDFKVLSITLDLDKLETTIAGITT